MALKPEVKKEWLAALRSGDYKQTRGLLCNAKGEMCCLGVAFDVAVDGEWVAVENPDSHDDTAPNVWAIRYMATAWNGRKIWDKNDGSLPPSILKRIGLTDLEQDKLIELNDTERLSFKRIANHIEKNL